MSSINRYAVSDVYEIIKHMNIEFRNKIPKSAMDFLKENRFKDHKSSIDFKRPLNEQKLNKDTKSLLTMFYLMSFCESEEEKTRIIKYLKSNKGDNKNG